MRSVASQAGAKDITLENDLPPALQQQLLRADPGQVGRVLVNLLNNAIRHTPPGGVVGIRVGAEKDGRVSFAVHDTGEGIPPSYQTHIFERFAQVPGATRGGAGLGLSLAQTIIRAHGGEIGVESTPGQGSTFTFTLPADATMVSGL